MLKPFTGTFAVTGAAVAVAVLVVTSAASGVFGGASAPRGGVGDVIPAVASLPVDAAAGAAPLPASSASQGAALALPPTGVGQSIGSAPVQRGGDDDEAHERREHRRGLFGFDD